jgi:ligand-binding sensor domain-containing protein
MYISDENVLWYSEPFQYEYYRLNSNYIEFTGKILEVMAVDNGLWVGTESGLYYLSGEEPSKFQMDIKETLTVISGTATQLSGSYEQQSGLPPGFKWLISTNIGIFLLANQGMLLNVSTPNVELESADSGTSLFLQTNGMNQYLSILKTNQNPNNSVMGDLIESTIVRNGIIIP